jgi:SAM-dependent methyltransferase
MKLHIGCGNNIKEGYVNVDKYVKNVSIKNWDIFNLPIDENSVDEVLAEHLAEHLTFQEEKEFFLEMYRVLKMGGKLILEVPDIEWVLRTFLEAKDDFKDFYQVGAVDHYFGNGLQLDNRWSLLATAIWGNQNGEGQFHKNGYTVDKLKAIAHILKFRNFTATTDFKKGTQVIIAILTK